MDMNIDNNIDNEKEVDKFLVIDGNSLFHRSYHGVKPLSNKDGTETHAIYGFLNTYLKIKGKCKPSHIAVAFDRHEPTFRHKLFEDYKANRMHMPDEFAEQLGYLKNILVDLGVKIVDCVGYEADDIMGTLSKVCDDSNMKCYLASGDRDIFQLISDNVSVIYLGFLSQELYDTEKFVKQYGFQPKSIIDFKAIAGDSSDNYKGIKGIGEKTLTPLIQQYGTVENIYKNLENAELTPRQKKLFTDNKDNAMLCKKLATIYRTVPIDTSIESYRYGGVPDAIKLLDLLEYLELNTFIRRFGLLRMVKNSLRTDIQMEIDLDIPQVKTSILRTNFTTKSEYTDYLIKNGTLYIIDKGKIFETNDLNIIVNYLESDIPKRTTYSKTHYSYTPNINNLIFDAELSGYLLDSSSKKHSIQELCKMYEVEYNESLGEFADVYALAKLNDELSTRVYAFKMDDLESLEIELARVLASMERVGVKVDIPTVKEYQEKLSQILKDLETEIYQQAGNKFNILSPQQLSDVLFKRLNLSTSGIRKTQTGYSTDIESLEKLKDEHPIVPLIVEYRFYHKLKSTYLDGILKSVSSDGRIHTVFRQTETRTGRLSSAEPNLQNIPIRNDFAKNIRKFFVADDNKVLIDADYNQIELRLTAVMSKDANMIESFLQGKDIHTATAMEIFNIPKEEEVTPQMRALAKSINFGLIYGMGARKLSKEIGVKNKVAQQYIDSYFETYPNIQTFMDKTISECKANGYVKTIMNRIRYIPEINSSSPILKAQGERIAMNTPIQGSSADIIKVAMVKVYNRLKSENLNANLILQVHDELLVECDKDCAETVAKVVKEEMESVIKLEVPLTVEVNIGGSWFDAH